MHHLFNHMPLSKNSTPQLSAKSNTQKKEIGSSVGFALSLFFVLFTVPRGSVIEP